MDEGLRLLVDGHGFGSLYVQLEDVPRREQAVKQAVSVRLGLQGGELERLFEEVELAARI